jgi:hypothetical protein
MKKKYTKYRARTDLIMDKLTVIQLEKIMLILLTLAKYLFLDRSTLNYFAGEKIGLSYIQKAKDYGLIVETQNRGDHFSRKEYFFKLGENGIHLLLKDGIAHKKFNVLVHRSSKEKVLTFNRFLKRRNIKDYYRLVDPDYNVYQSDNIIYYFSDEIDGKQIIRYFKNHIRSVILAQKKELLEEENKTKKKKEEIKVTYAEIRNYFWQTYNLIPIEQKRVKILDQTRNTWG